MFHRISIAAYGFAIASAVGLSQPFEDQQEALALLAKIDGKATFDPDHPRRVVGVDI